MIRFIRTLPLPPKLLPIAIIALMAAPTTAQSQRLPMVVSEPAFLAVSVADLEASTLWYTRVFGTETVRDITSRDGLGRAWVMMAGDLVVELISYQGSIDASEALREGQHRFALRGIVKTGLFVANADAAHAVLLAGDIDIDSSVIVDERIDAKTFVVRDPDGNRLQIFQHCRHGC